VRAWSYHNPVAIHFGVGSLECLPDVVGDRRAVVVTFPEAQACGLAGRVKRLLGDRCLDLIDRTPPNPDVENLEALYDEFWDRHAGCEVIVAVGGGSVLDTAKVLATAALAPSFDALLAGLAGASPYRPSRFKPLLAVPTTAGTGSEVTRWATVWDRAAGRKHSLDIAQTWPEAAIVDPLLALTLPPAPTVAAGLDALSHALEALWNVHANPVSDAHAIGAAREVMTVLPRVVAQPEDVSLRSRLALAALCAGLAFSNTRTALAHSMSYELTLRHGLAHGIACSFTLPLVLRLAIGVEEERDEALRRVFGGSLFDAPDTLERFLNRLGVGTNFADHGIAESEAARIIAAAADGVRGRNFIGSTVSLLAPEARC
jgi:phosphonate metabolism-associated iron-containing alcohol dehydrogenase